MAYARFGRSSRWYIFWHAGDDPRPSKNAEHLAVWHASHRAAGARFSYSEVVEMLATADFGRVPGRSPADDSLLRRCLEQFVEDVEREHR